MSVKAFGEDGSGAYADIIHGIDFVVRAKDTYNIRVLNLSFSALPQSSYWDDPLNQAVMRAWQSGIVVVVAAGNTGPEPMAVRVPDNVPYMVTDSAMTDNYTPDDGSDDYLASFSSAEPTNEGFVKPEMVAPGGHKLGMMPSEAQIALEYPEFFEGGVYLTMSGTPQAAARVSGMAALMLQHDPTLTPDEVKCRMMASARSAINGDGQGDEDGDGSLVYSIFQQGAGLVNAYDTVYSVETGCANVGIGVDNDLAGVEHYGGSANQDEDGTTTLWAWTATPGVAPTSPAAPAGCRWNSRGEEAT